MQQNLLMQDLPGPFKLHAQCETPSYSLQQVSLYKIYKADVASSRIKAKEVQMSDLHTGL